MMGSCMWWMIGGLTSDKVIRVCTKIIRADV